MSGLDIRWQQRFNNLKKAFAQLEKFIDKGDLSELDDLLLPYCIDISIYSQIENEDLIDHIRRVGVVLYRSSDASSRQTEQFD